MANSGQAQGLTDGYERVVRISRAQTAAHARGGASAARATFSFSCHSPTTVCSINQADVAVPYTGLLATYEGKKKAGPLVSAVKALGGQVS
jgi:hypothetical protein